MVGLIDGKVVTFQLRQIGGQAEELLHAQGEVGAVEQRPALLRQGLHFVEMVVPSSGADDDAAAQAEDGAHVFESRRGGCEVDDHIHAAEIGGGKRGGVLVLVHVKSAHGMTALTGHIGNETPGFSFA